MSKGPLARRRLLQAAGATALLSPLGARRAGAADRLLAVQIGSLAEPAAVPEAVQLGEGMRAAFAAVNARGGINGQQLELLQLDDGNDLGRFEQRFAEALAQRPLALLSLYGSPTVQRVLQKRMLDAADTVVLNAVPGAEAFREPGHPKLFHLRAGDGQQIERIVRHVKVLGIRRIGLLYVDAPGGHSGFAAANAAARAAGGVEVQGVKAALDAPSLHAAARSLASADLPCAVVMGPPRFMADAVAALRSAGFSQSIYAVSYLSPELLVQVAGRGAHGVGLSQAFPNPMGVVLPLQRELQAAMRSAFPALKQLTAFHLEGYVCARLFIEVARRMKGRSSDEFIRTLRALGEIDLGGFRLDFSRGNVGSRFVDIGIVKADGRLAY